MPAKSKPKAKAKPSAVFKTPKPSRALAHAARLARKIPITPKNPIPTDEPKIDDDDSEFESEESFMSTEDRVFPKGPEIKLRNKDQISPKKNERTTGLPKDEIIIEVHECNGEKFDGVLTRKDCKNLWTELGKPLTDLRRISRETKSPKLADEQISTSRRTGNSGAQFTH